MFKENGISEWKVGNAINVDCLRLLLKAKQQNEAPVGPRNAPLSDAEIYLLTNDFQFDIFLTFLIRRSS